MSQATIIRGKVEAHDFKPAPVKPTIIIGIGGSGGDILLRVRKRFFEKYGSLNQFPIVSYLWLDTDATEKDVGAGVFAEHIAFTPTEKLMTTMADTTKVTNDLNQYPHIKRWFYPGLTKLKTMTEGAGQIRAYSRLGFFHHFHEIRNAIITAASVVRNVANIQTVQERHNLEANPQDLQVFVVFSIAGGTGSGMFLDLAFLLKDIFRGSQLTSVGFILMPGLFNPTEDRIFANGYAALKEIEYYSYENDFDVEWPDGLRQPIPGPPFSYTYFIDRTNYAGNAVEFANRDVIFNMVAENIFKDFTQSEFAGYKRGVRVNLDQYLVDLFAFTHLNEHREPIIDQKFITRFSSFGLASITVPADRIEQACAYKLASDVVDHWGSLSHTEFNAAVLTDVVLREVLPQVGMYEGNFAAEGRIEQRRDIQNALLDDGRRQGQKIHNLINMNIAQAAREARDGVHKQKGQSMSQYLRAAVERELAKLRMDKADAQQWGDYSRAVYFNKIALGEHSEKMLHQIMARIVNEQHQSVGYAIALLRQVVNVLRDENREYIPSFARGRETAIKRAEEERRRLDRMLAEIARHESRKNWDGRKGTIMRYDVQRFEEIAPDYLNAVLLSQVRGAAMEICQGLIGFVGMAERTESGEVLSEGLIGELYTLGGQLENLKRRLTTKYEFFRQPSSGELSLMLYDPNDIETSYMPKYLGTGDKAQRQIENIGDQILQELRTSVMDLPRVVRQKGIDNVEHQIRDLARRPFSMIKKDFDVLETLYKKFPSETDRESKVRFIYNKAKFWLHGGESRSRSYQLSVERHKVIVGVPQDSADPIKREEFEELVKNRIQAAGDPAISIQRLPERSEIVFYSEVGGIPVNWADSVIDMRKKYLSKQAEGEELHIDCHEIKFEDLVVLDDRERAELEEAHECFLLGVIFGEIQPEKDANGNVRYSWRETMALTAKQRILSLGIEERALAELTTKKSLRETLLARVYKHIDRIRRDRDLLARFNALLGWYIIEKYPADVRSGADGVEYLEQSNMCRAVYKQLSSIEKHMETQQAAGLDSIEDFVELSRKYDAMLNSFAPVLIDGKRAFMPERPESVDKVFRLGG